MKQVLFLVAIYSLIYNQSTKNARTKMAVIKKQETLNSAITSKYIHPYIFNNSGYMYTSLTTYENNSEKLNSR